jgi:hypothetical protein
MLRTLRVLAVVGFAWMVGLFLQRVTGVGGGKPFMAPFTPISFLSTLGGELSFAVGILALMVTASRRQIAWCGLFALLVALLHVLPVLFFQSLLKFPNSVYPDFLSLFAVPLGPRAWVVLLPALIPGVAFIYTLMVQDGRPMVAVATRPPLTA